jgi:hypothetical protein
MNHPASAFAAHSDQIVVTVSRELTDAFGAWFCYSALTRMPQFVEGTGNEQIVSTLSTQLSLSHFVERQEDDRR